jgi:acetyltransferase
MGTASGNLLQPPPAVRVIRARAGDALLIADFYPGLSLDTRYERFFSHKPQFTPEELQRLSMPNPLTEVCVIALAVESDREIVVGEARCVVTRDSAAGREAEGEIAIVMADGWRRRGIGRRLLCALVAAARTNWYTGLLAYVAATNTGMLTLIRDFDFRSQPLAGATLRLVRKDLAPVLSGSGADRGCLQFEPQPAAVDNTALAAG